MNIRWWVLTACLCLGLSTGVWVKLTGNKLKAGSPTKSPPTLVGDVIKQMVEVKPLEMEGYDICIPMYTDGWFTVEVTATKATWLKGGPIVFVKPVVKEYTGKQLTKVISADAGSVAVTSEEGIFDVDSMELHGHVNVKVVTDPEAGANLMYLGKAVSDGTVEEEK